LRALLLCGLERAATREASRFQAGREPTDALRGRAVREGVRDHVALALSLQPIIPNGGVFSAPDITMTALRDPVVALVARHRLPAIYPDHIFIKSGGLMSYAADRVDLFRRAASYVDRILRGEKPGDLPVQQPTKYELHINLKTAKALGLEVPASVLARADEVIE
jgi:putative ABC transport system substrate-binding protein